MPHITQTRQKVDLRAHPGITAPADKEKQYTIGDLHGNALKLIFFLIKEGILRLSDADYLRLRTLYKKPTSSLLPRHFIEFETTLARADWSRVDKVRLMGDVFADRGNNDYFTLLIIEQLRKQHIPVDILYSNHDAEFIKCLQLGVSEPELSPTQGDSYKHMSALIKKGVIPNDRVKAFWKNTYTKSLKAIDYIIDDTVTPPAFTLLTHAPTGLETVRAAATRLGIDYQDETVYQLATTIDKINNAFQRHIQEGDFSILDLNKLNHDIVPIRYPFLRLSWNRGDYDHRIELPEKHNGYRLSAIHGHDGEQRRTHQRNRSNIDTDLGKKMRYSHNDHGTYLSLQNKVSPAMLSKVQKAKAAALTLEKEATTAEAALKKLASAIATETATITDEIKSVDAAINATQAHLQQQADEIEEIIEISDKPSTTDEAKIMQAQHSPKVYHCGLFPKQADNKSHPPLTLLLPISLPSNKANIS